MRKLREVEWEIDAITREMSRVLVAQVSMDEQLRHWNYRLDALTKEKQAILSSGDGEL